MAEPGLRGADHVGRGGGPPDAAPATAPSDPISPDVAAGSAGGEAPERRPGGPAWPVGRRLIDWHSFGWREGTVLGAVVLIAVYAVAEFTALLPPLRDALEHLPVTIAVLVVGTVAVLVTILRTTRD